MTTKAHGRANLAAEVVVLQAIWDLLGMAPKGTTGASNDMLDAREYLRSAGMPYKAVMKISGAFHIGRESDFAGMLGIPSRTLQRRKETGSLQFGEAVTFFVAAELFQRAVVVLGDGEIAAKWFQAPNQAIRGKRPLELLGDDLGRKLIEDLLGRIEHGVYE